MDNFLVLFVSGRCHMSELVFWQVASLADFFKVSASHFFFVCGEWKINWALYPSLMRISFPFSWSSILWFLVINISFLTYNIKARELYRCICFWWYNLALDTENTTWPFPPPLDDPAICALGCEDLHYIVSSPVPFFPFCHYWQYRRFCPTETPASVTTKFLRMAPVALCVCLSTLSIFS